MSALRPVMLAGTGSDVGKSILATGLCRIFKQDGYTPAPFKAQNMALNSYVTPDGLEIGRAQAVQAEAAGIECHTDMNPLLMKPSGERTSQVVLNGRPIGNRDAYDYFRRDGREMLRDEVHAAFDRLSSKYNPIVMEGAGSISELNLRDTDLVNMSMARYAGAAVLLVADIDRGGVFASAFGSVMLQSPEDRKRIRGIIINKFRGDLRLFEDGRRIMEEICSVPVIGVVPYMDDIHIEEEDSVALTGKQHSHRDASVNIAVVQHPHISNYTDFDALERHPAVNLFYTYDPAQLKTADIIILPGSKSTISDLTAMRRSGIDEAIAKAHEEEKSIIGICGGYQMMGLSIDDPEGVEGGIGSADGMGLLPVRTVLSGNKTTQRRTFSFINGKPCTGYEIHMGVTEICAEKSPVGIDSDGNEDGYILSDRCFGTYMHGLFDNANVVDYILAPYTTVTDSDFDYSAYRDKQYDLLAARLREYLDLDLIYKIMKSDV